MRDSTAANAVLLRFYKDRIVDVMLARSPVFGLLHHEDRRAITDRFSLCVFEAGASVIREGETSSQIYLIKDGEAEVLTEREGVRDTLSTLGPGTVFGEVAALRGIPRTATVVAKTKLETLCLEGADFQAILDARPEVRKKVQDVVAKRARENLDKLVHLHPTP
jgi:CRP-like cAMP-binding protein